MKLDAAQVTDVIAYRNDSIDIEIICPFPAQEEPFDIGAICDQMIHNIYDIKIRELNSLRITNKLYTLLWVGTEITKSFQIV